MPKHSAGILFYRFRNNDLEVFLVHPGGPFWTRKDKSAWSIPKGEVGEEEESLAAAKREVAEEAGIELKAPLMRLGALKQANGKIVHAWAAEQTCDPDSITSNTFTMEWPPKSGKTAEFPEIDRAAWYSTRTARAKLHKGQKGFIDKLRAALGLPPEDAGGETGQDNHDPKQGELF